MRSNIHKRLEELEDKQEVTPDKTTWQDVGREWAAAFCVPYEALLIGPDTQAKIDKVYGAMSAEEFLK